MGQVFEPFFRVDPGRQAAMPGGGARPCRRPRDHPVPRRRPHPRQWMRKLHQLQCLEAGMAVLADDDVVVHLDAQGLGHVDDALRHLDIGARGGRVAGGVVMTLSMYRIKSFVFNVLDMFWSPMGYRIGGCKKWNFVFIPVDSARSPPLPQKHAQARISGSRTCHDRVQIEPSASPVLRFFTM